MVLYEADQRWLIQRTSGYKTLLQREIQNAAWEQDFTNNLWLSSCMRDDYYSFILLFLLLLLSGLLNTATCLLVPCKERLDRILSIQTARTGIDRIIIYTPFHNKNLQDYPQRTSQRVGMFTVCHYYVIVIKSLISTRHFFEKSIAICSNSVLYPSKCWLSDKVNVWGNEPCCHTGLKMLDQYPGVCL